MHADRTERGEQMKRILSFLVLFPVLLSSLAACSKGTEVLDRSNMPKQGSIVSLETLDDPSEPDVSELPFSEGEENLQPVRAIVFEETIADPLVALMGDAVAFDGTAAISLMLFEDSPDTFGGTGILRRHIEVHLGDRTATDSQYRLVFSELKPGNTLQAISLTQVNAEQSIPAGTPELGAWNTQLFSTRQIPVECILSLDGDAAQMHVKIENFEYAFSGKSILLSPQKPASVFAGRAISINSTFFEHGKPYNHEYRAMLTASQDSGGGYSGNLCVYGSGKDIPFVDENVSFTLNPFDEAAYKQAGGMLPGSFDAFAVLPCGYFILMDGDRPLLEAANTGIAFYGLLIDVALANEAQLVAIESKQLMRILYDGCDRTKYDLSGTPNYWSGKPAWYPDLLPTPYKLKAGSQRWTEMSNIMGYNVYTAYYEEEGSEIIDSVLDSYMQQLSNSVTNLESFVYAEPGYLPDASIFFTVGIFRGWIYCNAFAGGIDVIVRIA